MYMNEYTQELVRQDDDDDDDEDGVDQIGWRTYQYRLLILI